MSHSSTDAEVISLDSGLRMAGLSSITLRDIVIDVLELLASRARCDIRFNLNPKHPKLHRNSLLKFQQTRESPVLVLIYLYLRTMKL